MFVLAAVCFARVAWLLRLSGLVFAEDAQFAGEWAHSVDALAVAHVVVVSYIDVEKVLPLLADNG